MIDVCIVFSAAGMLVAALISLDCRQAARSAAHGPLLPLLAESFKKDCVDWIRLAASYAMLIAAVKIPQEGKLTLAVAWAVFCGLYVVIMEITMLQKNTEKWVVRG